jgi:phosphoenolpyruvate carboxykinase (GTP)
MNVDESIFQDESHSKIKALNNPHVEGIIETYIKLCKPQYVRVLTDSKEDIRYARELAQAKGEERKLKLEGHSIHFDGYSDQARDPANTRILLPEGRKISRFINTLDRETGLREIHAMLDGIMTGKEMLICFFSLGPTHSRYSIPALQITDSAYVVHCEDMLYRQGYEEFKNLRDSHEFFYFVHSAGELDESHNSRNLDQRRTYIDLEERRVFSINNQYAGSSVGLKKLALRLAISKAYREDWLCEHMFISGVRPAGKNRVTYFTGAFPSACGKTSTAMVPGHTIVGDDIAYIGPDPDGMAHAVNVEQGIFGIIDSVNPKDDPVIFKALTSPREVIFSNLLVSDGKPYWPNMGRDIPEEGTNYSGDWYKGKKDSKGQDIPFSSKNSRYTIRINELDNADPRADDPKGVPIGGIIYGGRDSDTSVPVVEAFNWSHGVYLGACIESETTAAAIGKVGVLKHNPMANLEFLTIPIGAYISKHLAFGESLDHPPLIFKSNYFLKEKGKFMNAILDKKVWLWWMEGRVHKEFEALTTPVGHMPRYDDLKSLFQKIFERDYSEDDYCRQFALRITNLLEKVKRMEAVFKNKEGVPAAFLNELASEKERLQKAKTHFGRDIVSPFDLE